MSAKVAVSDTLFKIRTEEVFMTTMLRTSPVLFWKSTDGLVVPR